MRALVRWVRRAVMQRRWRRRFPLSKLYDGTNLSEDSSVGPYAVLFPGVQLLSSSVGAYSYIQAGTAVFNADIGPFCSIAGNVTIGLAAHPTYMVSTSPVFYDPEQPLPRFFARQRVFTNNLPRTVIEADVWIGQGAMIKAGVRIGVGSVIGAGAVVTKDLEPYQIAAGNPCRVIRPRFSVDVITRLLESRWWELEDATIEPLACQFADPEALLAELAARRDA